MKKVLMMISLVYLLIIGVIVNGYMLLTSHLNLLFLFLPTFIFINAFAGTVSLQTKNRRLKICYHGGLILWIFEISVLVAVIYHIILAFQTIPNDYMTFIWSLLYCIFLEGILFWNGIICVYLTSIQLGIKQRVIGVIFGMIPVINLIVLNSMIRTVFKEVYFEIEKDKVNLERHQKKVCKTKYPILMVHGVFFRDNKYFNYWGRIPKELELNGAQIYYGNHQSAASIADSARELSNRIRELVKELNCEKINIIAHSKGGLDCRYAIAKYHIAHYVASLTTINTPHRGCVFADYLLTKISPKIKKRVAATYNSTLKKFGDEKPDFLAAVNDLTASFCSKLDREIKSTDNIFCQSVGSLLPRASSGKFPLNFSYHLAKHFDGANDGLVCEKSFEWGEKYTLLSKKLKHGISHGDMIDLNRKNIEGFDVREFYVGLVNDLKKRGF